MRQLRTLAFVTAGFAYGLIVLGAAVRITGSGLGCGDEWPLCHGRLIPPLHDLPTLIEWSHRLAAAGVSLLTLALAAVALFKRSELGVAGRGGPLRPALLAGALLVAQVVLGAVTVWLELPPWVVTLHLATAMALLASVLVAAFRAGYPGEGSASVTARGSAGAALALAALTLLLGGLTASTGAGYACQGFPLCSGRLWPSAESGLAEIQWVHRLAAYALVLHLAGFAARVRRRDEAPAVRNWVWATAGLALLQVVVAIVMVTMSLSGLWRAVHAAVGTALWASAVWLATRASPALAGRAWPRGSC